MSKHNPFVWILTKENPWVTWVPPAFYDSPMHEHHRLRMTVERIDGNRISFTLICEACNKHFGADLMEVRLG